MLLFIYFKRTVGFLTWNLSPNCRLKFQRDWTQVVADMSDCSTFRLATSFLDFVPFDRKSMLAGSGDLIYLFIYTDFDLSQYS